MPHLVVVGGSVVGSVTALLFARAGWQVDVFDPEFELLARPGPRVSARAGAPHAVHAHGFMARTRVELRDRLPDVLAELVAAGVGIRPGDQGVPPHLYDGGRPGDDDLTVLRVRRVTLDQVVASAVEHEDGITVRVDRVTGLLHDGSTITGVHTAAGEVRADLVVDAAGRRSPVTGWLGALGVAVEERVDPCFVRYYSRQYALAPGEPPPLNAGFAEVHEFRHFAQLLFLGDNNTAMLACAVHDEDPVLKDLRHAAAYDALVAANPGFDAWRAVMTPITEVFCLGALDNRMRSLTPGGEPALAGLVQVGDSLAMTNPTRGRGISMGLAAAGTLVDLVVRDGLAGPDLVAAYDAWQRRVLSIYYRESVASDDAVSARLRAALLGETVPANAPWVLLPEEHPITHLELEHAAGRDPELIRCVLRASMLLDDDRDIAGAEVVTRTRRVLDEHPLETASASEPHRLDDRAQLTALLADALAR